MAGLSLRRMAGVFSPLVGAVVLGLPPRAGESSFFLLLEDMSLILFCSLLVGVVVFYLQVEGKVREGDIDLPLR